MDEENLNGLLLSIRIVEINDSNEFSEGFEELFQVCRNRRGFAPTTVCFILLADRYWCGGNLVVTSGASVHGNNRLGA